MVGEKRSQRGKGVGRWVVFRVEQARKGVVADEVDLLWVGVEGGGGEGGGFGVEVGESGEGDVDRYSSFSSSFFCLSLLAF